MDQLLQAPRRDWRWGGAERDDLALSRQPDSPAMNDRRHRQDRLVSAPTTPADRPAAAVEEPEVDGVLTADLSEVPLGKVQRPVGHPVAAVLVAVGVPEHDLLKAAARFGLGRVDLVLEQFVHETGNVLEVFGWFDERDECERA